MTTKRSAMEVSGYIVGCAMLSMLVLAYGAVPQADEYPDEEPVQLDESTIEQLNEAVGGRSVNFVLTFVEEEGAIVPAAGAKKLVEVADPPDIAGNPTRVILFVDDNDKICVQKPSGEWKCYESS